MRLIKTACLMSASLMLYQPSISFAKDSKLADTENLPAPVRTSLFDDQAQSVLAEWFSIDPQHKINMQQEVIEADATGERFSLNFISDDQMPVNGLLNMPKGYDAMSKEPFKLALFLHPMGSDQSIWFSQDNPIKAGSISQKLREQGYAVLVLDARRHGQRKVDDMSLGELIGRAHSPHRRLYDDMIIGSVRDYRLVLAWMASAWNISTEEMAVVGYSMGAQMSLLLASYEPSISHVMTMVPPYVDQAGSPVAPRHHVSRITDAKLLFLAAKQDPYSTADQNQQVFDLIGSQHKEIHYFDSGHLLPEAYLEVVMQFIGNNMVEES